MTDHAAVIRARRSNVYGEHAQNLARSTLVRMGFAMVERIETGYVRRKGRWVPGARVSGDYRGVAPGGRSVLAEVKHRAEQLVWSDLERHQADALDHHAKMDGLSLLIWVRLAGLVEIDVLDWRALRRAGFAPRAVLTPGCEAILAARLTSA